MNQSLQIDVTIVMETVRASGLLTSLCTVKTPPADTEDFDAGGALKPDAVWPELSGVVDVPCTAPPLQTTDNVSALELKSMMEIQAKSVRHVLLDGYYPTIEEHFRAEIDGVDFDITNVESDSQKQMTRLAIQLVTL